MSYFISVDGSRKEGPLSLEAMKLKLLNNEVDESTLLWKQGMSEWRPAGEVVEFKELVKTLPPPLPDKEIVDSSFSVPSIGGKSEYSDEFSAKLAILEDHRRGIINVSERDELIRKVSDYFSEVQDSRREGNISGGQFEVRDDLLFDDEEVFEQLLQPEKKLEDIGVNSLNLSVIRLNLHDYLTRNVDGLVVHGFCMHENVAWMLLSALRLHFLANVGRYLLLTQSGLEVLFLRRGNSVIYKREFLPFKEYKVVKSRMGKHSWMLALKGGNSSYVFSGSYSSKNVKCLSRDELMQVLEYLNQ